MPALFSIPISFLLVLLFILSAWTREDEPGYEQVMPKDLPTAAAFCFSSLVCEPGS